MTQPPKVSVVLATFARPAVLAVTLQALFRQRTDFLFEIVIVDDGPDTGTKSLCAEAANGEHIVRYFKTGNQEYRNPGFARNIGYKHAKGEVIVAMSDDVVCQTSECIHHLANIATGTFNIGHVYNSEFVGDRPGERGDCYTGLERPSPLFFLGSLRRKHCYAIGGNCEEFSRPGFEDNWFADCLIMGLHLIPVFRPEVVGYHQSHERRVQPSYYQMERLYHRKRLDAAAGRIPWRGGEPWPL